jgi:hypothetical protein
MGFFSIEDTVSLENNLEPFLFFVLKPAPFKAIATSLSEWLPVE